MSVTAKAVGRTGRRFQYDTPRRCFAGTRGHLMIKTKGYAATSAKSPLKPYAFERREPGEHDVVFDIKFCGICHTDIHLTRSEFSGSTYPMVPGHEIVGVVTAVGS